MTNWYLSNLFSTRAFTFINELSTTFIFLYVLGKIAASILDISSLHVKKHIFSLFLVMTSLIFSTYRIKSIVLSKYLSISLNDIDILFFILYFVISLFFK